MVSLEPASRARTEYPHGLVDRVRHPHPGQLARPMQPRQGDRVPAVRLDPLARPLRDQRRSNHGAVVAEVPDLPAQTPWVRPQSTRAGDHSDLPSFPIIRSISAGLFSISPRNRTSPVRPPSTTAHCVLQLRDVERNESLPILPHGSPSVREDRLGLPEQPSSS